MSKNKAINILLCITSVLLLIVLLFGSYVLIIYLKSTRHITTPQLICNYELKNNVLNELYYELNDLTLPEKEYKELIEKQLSVNLYKYIETNELDVNGDCNMYTRTIRINTNRKRMKYARTFTHEVMHLTKYSVNEIYICYETFKFLYENDNEYLHNVGVDYAIDVLCNNVAENYNITNQIMYYFLIEKENINV